MKPDLFTNIAVSSLFALSACNTETIHDDMNIFDEHPTYQVASHNDCKNLSESTSISSIGDGELELDRSSAIQISNSVKDFIETTVQTENSSMFDVYRSIEDPS